MSDSRKTKNIIATVIRQRLFVVLLLIIQLAVYATLILHWSMTSRIVGIAMTALSWIVALVITNSERQPSYKVRWIIIVLLFPILGTATYILFDRDLVVRNLRRRLRRNQNRLRALTADDGALQQHFAEETPKSAKLATYLSAQGDFPLYESQSTRFLPTGEAFWESMLEDMRRAKRYIFIEFFIIEEGKMLDSVLDVLETKAAEGVDVRFMYDDLGSLFKAPEDYHRQLEARGIRTRKFNPLRPLLTVTLNNRDHRKIVAIDGEVAYTGGVNLADEYINAVERFGHWKDAGIRIEGSAAWSFTLMFLHLWDEQAADPEAYQALLPSDRAVELPPEGGYVQPFADSPFDMEWISDSAFMDTINRANDYIYITTPYLIVDYGIQEALQIAAKSGVDVRIITPHQWDKKLVHMTTRTYYASFIESGVKIYEYTPGFIHSKTLVADDEVAIVGTVNFDYRSLYLHFECGTMLYGTPSVREVKADFLQTQAVSEPIGLEDCPQGRLRAIGGEILRLFAPFM